MKNAREKIFAQIHASLQRGELNATQKKECSERLDTRPRGILPHKAQLTGERLQNLFIEQARYALAKVEKIDSLADAPKIILQILQQQQLPLSLRIASHPELKTLPWNQHPQCILKEGVASHDDTATLSLSFCGIAETGTLVFLSRPETPTTLNFLTEIHIALLALKDILPYYEDAWDLIRTKNFDPRVVNFITGPSRTADIEQTVQIGIHGPKQLYILLYV